MNANNTEGFIAVWLGNFKSEDDFKEYIKIHYEYEDDKDIDSQFEKDFGLKYYDRNIVESVKLQSETNTLKELFEGSSYLEEYIESLDYKNKLQFNVIIRVYDYKYDGEKQSTDYNGNLLNFFKNIEYEKVIDLSWMGL